MKSLTIILLVVATFFAWSAALPPEQLNVFYIDASMPTADDGMNESSLYTLKTKMEAAADAGEIRVVLSNGTEPFVIKKKKEIEKLLDKIYSSRFDVPNFGKDKTALRDVVYPDLAQFNGIVNFHFFLSDMSTKAIRSGSDSMVKFLPKEVGQIIGSTSNLVVNIYYSNNSGKVSKVDLDKALQFFNGGEFGPAVTYNTFDL